MKVTDNEIVKALEMCHQHRECCFCNFVEECGSKRVLTTSALDLINRQKKEIEILQNRTGFELYLKQKSELEKKDIEIDILIRKKEALNDEISELKAEVEGAKLRYEEIKADRDKEHQYAMHYARMCAKAKSEAIKEFAERLKAKADSGFWHELNYVSVEDICDLVEEMTE